MGHSPNTEKGPDVDCQKVNAIHSILTFFRVDILVSLYGEVNEKRRGKKEKDINIFA
jgi:hypothetical protein